MTGQPDGSRNRRNRLRSGRLGRFGRSQDGATAVEFGLIAMPFFMVLCAIIEMAFMFWTNEVLEEAVSETSRTLLTGQSRGLYSGGTAGADFKRKVCENAPALIDCSKLTIDVRAYTNFSDANTGTDASNPIQGGALNTRGFGFNAPAAEQIVVVRAVLEYSLFFTQWSNALANIGDGKRGIVASTTFRTEPFT